MKIISTGLIVGILSFLAACSKTQPSEPVSGDAPIANIDPDQKAMPTDLPPEPAKMPVTDTTLDGKGEQIAAGSSPAPTPTATAPVQTPESQTTPPPTPSVNETTASEPAPAVEAAPADVADTNVASNPDKVGSGPQTRFIKAWELNIRSEPNRFSKIIGHLKGGDEVHVKIHGGWAKLDDGRWIRSRWLVKVRPAKFVGAPGEESEVKPRAHKPRKAKKHKAPAQ
jgi:hypothetical protein